MRLRLTGYLLDLVDHHEGIRQAHLHRVIDRTDLGHLNRDLGGWGNSISDESDTRRTAVICSNGEILLVMMGLLMFDAQKKCHTN